MGCPICEREIDREHELPDAKHVCSYCRTVLRFASPGTWVRLEHHEFAQLTAAERVLLESAMLGIKVGKA